MEYWIETYKGNQFDYENIEANDVDIEDIAHALSNNCRFNGHCKKHYSVAEHSIHVSEHVRPEWALQGLLHDASETYMPDIPKPLKIFWSLEFNLKVFEDRITNHIYNYFGIEHNEKIHKEIKRYDLATLREERNTLFKKKVLWRFPENIPQIQINIKPLTPEEAEAKFLERYYNLTWYSNENSKFISSSTR
jgi:5'-deoxynucleotidase YfbR-like HD superfamily hydrolase